MSVTYATWDPTTKGSAITLSNGNLTAAQTSSAGSVLSTIGLTTGKWYWEVKLTVASGNPYTAVGVWSGSIASYNYVGQTSAGWGLVTNGSQLAILHNGSAVNEGSTPFVINDVIGIALNANTGATAFYRNNALIGSATVTTGTIYAAIGGYGYWVTAVANFGATALKYTPPTGYNTGVYTGPLLGNQAKKLIRQTMPTLPHIYGKITG
jgi:hypothetical protein